QLDQLFAGVKAPLLSGAQTLDQPCHTVRFARGARQPDHEVLKPFRYPALFLRLMRHGSSLSSRLRPGLADRRRRDVSLACPMLAWGPQLAVKITVKCL